MNIDQIIELDRINMEPVIEQLNLPFKFNPDLRRKGIEKEINEGAKFIFIERDNIIIAYFEYIMDDFGVCKIPSIQIHPEFQNGIALKKLLDKVYSEWSYNCPLVVTTSVHKTNKKSLNLHKRLGFEVVNETNERVEFKIPGEKLIKRIEFFLRKTPSSSKN